MSRRPDRRSRFAQAWGIADAAPLALYTGTFEAYQGVDMLIDAVAMLVGQRPEVRVLVVGGEPAQVEQAKARAASSGAAAAMVFTGQQPAKEIPGFVQAADLLVSPRIRGTNTPLKIYSYLRSGKPIVATNLLTHTQVLTPAIARLVDPKPEPFAAAMLELHRPAAGTRRGCRPRRARSRRRSIHASRTWRAPRRRTSASARRYLRGDHPVSSPRRVKVLVTGATGFTGGHLAQHLARSR